MSSLVGASFYHLWSHFVPPVPLPSVNREGCDKGVPVQERGELSFGRSRYQLTLISNNGRKKLVPKSSKAWLQSVGCQTNIRDCKRQKEDAKGCQESLKKASNQFQQQERKGGKAKSDETTEK